MYCCAMTILLSPVTSVEVHDHSVLYLPWHRVCCSSPCCCFRVVDNGRLRRITKVGSMEWWLKTKKWDGFLLRGISCGWYIVWGRCWSIFCVHDFKACHSIDVGTIERRFQDWQRQGLGCLISCVTRGIICSFYSIGDMWRLFDIAPFEVWSRP